MHRDSANVETGSSVLEPATAELLLRQRPDTQPHESFGSALARDY